MRKKQAAAGSGWAGRELEVRGHRGGLCCMQGSVAVAVGWLFRCGVERCSGPPPCCQGAEVASIHPLRLRRAGLVALGRSGGHLQALALEGLPNVAAGRQGNGWVGGWVGGEYRAGSQDCCSHHGGGPCVSCAQHQRAGPSCTARDAAQPWRAFPAHALTVLHSPLVLVRLVRQDPANEEGDALLSVGRHTERRSSPTWVWAEGAGWGGRTDPSGGGRVGSAAVATRAWGTWAPAG